MNSGPVSERIYETLKQRILTNAFMPGAHLDPTVLNDELASSVTPVREALYRLAGERLVDMRTGGGFHMPFIDEPGLQDLYSWHAGAVLAAIRLWPRATLARPEAPAPFSSELTAAGVFEAIGRCAANSEVTQAIARLSDRLNAIRTVEEHVLDGIGFELEALDNELARQHRGALRGAVTRYHRRRHGAAAAIVRALYRRG
jgi:DNA-binding GntR family transcriptional regulator